MSQTEDDVKQGTKFDLKEDWGETYKGGNPAIFVASLSGEGGIYQVENVPQDVSFGQVQWSPSSDELVFVGWPNSPRRLGIIHCFNRPSTIYSIKIDREQVLKSLKPQSKEEKEAAAAKQTEDAAAAKENANAKPDDTSSFLSILMALIMSLLLRLGANIRL
jgi:acylaminoacyl-peptidase